MKFFILADTHFTDRPQDEYRFGIFDWLIGQIEEHRVVHVFHLGDVCENKDRHSARLVNRLVHEWNKLQEATQDHLWVLKGNHDFIDPANPYFGFMGMVTKPTWYAGINLIPYQASQEEFDWACGFIEPGDGVFCHQCFTGAVSETGAGLSGISTAALEARKPKWVFAGDIHRPQTVGPVVYTGSPYQTRFGEDYEPHVVLFDSETQEKTFLGFPAPKKITLHITSPSQIQGKAGDHVKISLELPREEITSWANKKAEILEVCKVQGLEVFGVELVVSSSPERITLKNPEARTDEGIFESFCLANDITSKTKDAGLALLGST